MREGTSRPPSCGARARRERFAAAKARLDAATAQAQGAHERHLGERAAKEQASGRKLRGRKAKPPPPADESQAKANTSDPDSRTMKTKDGYLQGCNAQAVATDDQIVVAAEVTDEHNDHAQLHPMIAATNQALAEAGIDADLERLHADAGYCSEDNLAALTDEDPQCFIATRNQRRNPQPRNGRRGPLRAAATLVDTMDRKVSKKAGRAACQKRQHIIEPVFGQTKDARGARRFMRRGKAAAASEWKLLMGTHNLLKPYRQSLTDPSARPWTPRAGAPRPAGASVRATNIDPRREGGRDLMTAVLEVRNLEKSFGGVPVLRDVSFRVEAGEVVTLAGENGAGKSTVMKIVTGQVQRDAGEVLVDGEAITHIDTQVARALGVAIVPQELAPYPVLAATLGEDDSVSLDGGEAA